jgi:hypothetical protein
VLLQALPQRSRVAMGKRREALKRPLAAQRKIASQAKPGQQIGSGAVKITAPKDKGYTRGSGRKKKGWHQSAHRALRKKLPKRSKDRPATGKPKNTSVKITEAPKGQTRDKVGAAIGMSGPTRCWRTCLTLGAGRNRSP